MASATIDSGFNADFDGDEMNLHVPQTVQARAECYELLAAQENTLKASDGKASVVPVQGDRLATALMTKEDAWLTKSQWFMCLSDLDDGGDTAAHMLRRAREKKPAKFPVHARRLWSLALPDGYNWTNGECAHCQRRAPCRKRDEESAVAVGARYYFGSFRHGGAELSAWGHAACNTYNTRINPSTIHFCEIAPSDELTEKCKQVVAHMHKMSLQPGANSQECMTKATQMITGMVHAEQSRALAQA